MTAYEEWLAGLPQDALAALLRRRVDVALDPPPRTYESLAHLLQLPRSVDAALRRLDRGLLCVLGELDTHRTRAALIDHFGGARAEDVDRAVGVLISHGLVWPSGDGFRRTALRDKHFELGDAETLRPPEPRAVPAPDVPAPNVSALNVSAQQLAIARYCEAADVLIGVVDSGAVAVLKARGVGVRDVRTAARTAKLDDEHDVELVLTVAHLAGVLDVSGTVARCTTEYPSWSDSSRATKSARSIALWWHAEGSPTNRPAFKGKATPLLGLSVSNPSTAVLRHRIIAEIPAGGFADESDAVAYIDWAMPDLVADACPGDVAAVWREAHTLGVFVGGAPTELSHALGRLGSVDVDAVANGIARIVSDIVDNSECTLRLLPDLTAVVSGPVSEGLSTLFNSAAEVETKDAASTWRFTPASVRRYLAGGGTPSRLIDVLADASVTDIPQPLEYLIRDSARSSGDLVAHRTEVARPQAPRLEPLLVTERLSTDPQVLAAALTSEQPVPVDLERVAATIRAWCRLPARDVDAVAHAVALGSPISVGASNPRVGIVRDELSDLVLDAGVLHGRSASTGERHSVPLTRILSAQQLAS